MYGEGPNQGQGEYDWVVGRDRAEYDSIFYELGPIDGKIPGAAAKQEFIKSKLPNSELGHIWKLADIDRDGWLDMDEFALAKHLMKVRLAGFALPNVLPYWLMPPSKRDRINDFTDENDEETDMDEGEQRSLYDPHFNNRIVDVEGVGGFGRKLSRAPSRAQKVSNASSAIVPRRS